MHEVGKKPLNGAYSGRASEKPHSRHTKRASPRLPVTIPIVTPQAGQIGGRSSASGAGFLIRPG